MMSILEYLWVRNPQIVLQLVEMNSISAKIVDSIVKRKMQTEINPSYVRLMEHDSWQRVRGGAIRQVSSCEG